MKVRGGSECWYPQTWANSCTHLICDGDQGQTTKHSHPLPSGSAGKEWETGATGGRNVA